MIGRLSTVANPPQPGTAISEAEVGLAEAGRSGEARMPREVLHEIAQHRFEAMNGLEKTVAFLVGDPPSIGFVRDQYHCVADAKAELAEAWPSLYQQGDAAVL